MLQKHGKSYMRLKEYMRGWKHGAAAAAKLTETGTYADGYRDGARQRALAANEAQRRFSVSDDEIMRGVLR